MRYFVALITLLLSGVIISSVHKETSETVAEIAPAPTDELVFKEVFKVEKYNFEATRKVSHKLDSLLTRINKRHDFHGSVLVAKNDKLLYSNHIGIANFQKKTKIDDSSIFQLASVSKQFTATAILMLEEQNLLQLTDTVNTFFPDFPYEGITVEHLLNHTAGLPKYFWIAEHKWNDEIAPTNADMMSLLETSNVQRFFIPGRKFDYSNSAYFVLASIIEKVSKVSYAEFIEQRIFKPLQMYNSFVYSYQYDDPRKDQLDGYRLYRGWRHAKIGGTVNDAIVGDKNIYSTSEDLFKWMVGLNNGKLISQESLEKMYTKSKNKYGRDIPYGYGFRIKQDNDEKVVYHYGKWNGFSTALSQYTESDLLIIVLEHSSYNSMNYLNKNIKQLVEANFSAN